MRLIEADVKETRYLFEQSEMHLLYLSDLAGGYNMDAVYNATHGKALDLVECAFGLFRGASTDPVHCLHQMWNKHFDKYPNNLLVHFCTSHGAILTNRALLEYSVDKRKNIRVIGIAPATYISDKICHSIQNYEAPWHRDVIPRIDFIGRQKYKHTVKVMKSHPESGFFDHSFSSKTFEKVIKYELDYYKNLVSK